MTHPAIRLEDLGKRYRIDHAGQRTRYRTLRESLVGLAASPLRRWRGGGDPRSEEFWALKGIGLEIRPGEVVGIIGRNGAGKSTFLKILSRITKPTAGHVELRGRVGSLLEVGTGFHPELTGRENIYLSGAILGMSRDEIRSRFDEIVAFAEIERFLDTPVKRYSSGMYVRLAFAVAAHMDSEILLVDEVLAVGDTTFQKKCLRAMGDVAGAGRTVIFVSHNLAALRNLCPKTIWLKGGRLQEMGHTPDLIRSYLSEGSDHQGQWTAADDDRPTGEFRLRAASVLGDGGDPAGSVDCQQPFQIAIDYEVLHPLPRFDIGIELHNSEGIAVLTSRDSDALDWGATRRPGRYRTVCTIPAHLLAPNSYSVSLSADVIGQCGLDYQPNVLNFEVAETGSPRARRNDRREGVIMPIFDWARAPLS